MAVAIAETLYEMVGDWRIANNMRATVPKNVLLQVVKEWSSTRGRYVVSRVEVVDKRAASYGERKQALIVHTRYDCSGPRDVWFYEKVSLEASWASKGVQIGEYNVSEHYKSKDFMGVEYEHEYVKVYHRPQLRHNHGWALVALKYKKDGDNYDRSEECLDYRVILV